MAEKKPGLYDSIEGCDKYLKTEEHKDETRLGVVDDWVKDWVKKYGKEAVEGAVYDIVSQTNKALHKELRDALRKHDIKSE